MYINAKSEEDLIAKSPHQETLKALEELVTATTKLEKHFYNNGKTYSAISYGRLGNLGRKDYAYADAGLININSQKNYVGLYIWAGGDGQGIIGEYTKDMPKNTHNKGCLYVKDVAFLEKHKDVIKSIILAVN